MSMTSLYRSTALLALSLLAVSCGSSTPAEPTPSPTPTPVTVVSTPAPTPTPINPRTACGIGPGVGSGLESACPRSGESFLIEVNGAIDRVAAKNPQIFDFDNQRGDGGYFVKDVNRYYNAVVMELATVDRLCAVVDGGGEIAVKSQNSFNDQYHIMLSSGHVRRGDTSYRATCAPAWF
jgi:hypothetical protein